jgi:hypothetical protein
MRIAEFMSCLAAPPCRSGRGEARTREEDCGRYRGSEARKSLSALKRTFWSRPELSAVRYSSVSSLRTLGRSTG